MFDNVDLKIKGGKVVLSATGITGKEKICSIELENIDKVEWAKDTKKILVTVLIDKGYGELAVKLADKKAKAA